MRFLATLWCVLFLVACGGGGGSAPGNGDPTGGTPSGPTYRMSGSIAGLGSASGLSIQISAVDAAAGAAETLTIAPNTTTFTFATRVVSNSFYRITVVSQPAGLYCSTSPNLVGNITADSTVLIDCARNPGVSFLAGNNQQTHVDGSVAEARFNAPRAVAIDRDGNAYVAEANAVRKISIDGRVSTLAGSMDAGFADGIGSAARFSAPVGIAVDGAGNVYVADWGNHAIRKVSPTGGVTTLAGNGVAGFLDASGSAARLRAPSSIAIDDAGILYVGDAGNYAIRKISATGEVTTLAGNGTAGTADGVGSVAHFSGILGVALDSFHNVYVTERSNTIRKIAPDGTVTTPLNFNSLITGVDGGPFGIAVDGAGTMYVSGWDSNVVWKVTPSGVISTFVGSRNADTRDGSGTSAQFNYAAGLALDAAGNLYVTELLGNTIRKVTPDGVVTTLAGKALAGFLNGAGSAASFRSLKGLAVDSSGTLYVADTFNFAIRKVTSTGGTSTLVGNGLRAYVDGSIATARLDFPLDVALDGAGNVYVAEGSAIRKVSVDGVVSTMAGDATASGYVDGVGTAARFTNAAGIAADAAGNVYVADFYNNAIRKISPGGVVTTLAGSGRSNAFGEPTLVDGTGSAARFNHPADVAVDSAGNVYVADSENFAIRKISPQGAVTTLAGSGGAGYVDGSGAAALFTTVKGIAVDSAGTVYVADSGNNVIRKVSPAGVVTTLAGTRNTGMLDEAGKSYRGPSGVAVDRSGVVYVSFDNLKAIVKVLP